MAGEAEKYREVKVAGLIVWALTLWPGTITAASHLPGPVLSFDLSSEGRGVAEIQGDLWLFRIPSSNSQERLQWTRLTSGRDWDRDPVWLNVNTIVFSSDRRGSFDLWQVELAGNSAAAPLLRLTDGERDDRFPDALSDGSIIFSRGTEVAADLWKRTPDGESTRLTEEEGTATAPKISPDDAEVVYIQRDLTSSSLKILHLDSGKTRTVLSETVAEAASWAPDGKLITYTTRRGRPTGVWVMPVDGSYQNLVSPRESVAVWTPDGGHLLLSELPRPGPGYNGDPARVRDRELGDFPGQPARLRLINAPQPLEAHPRELVSETRSDRRTRNLQAFDRVWDRTTNLYYDGARAQMVQSIRSHYREEAAAADSDEALDDVIFRSLRERPPLKEEVRGEAAVSSAHPLATGAGVEILQKGGNVVDAAVAVSFALGVVEPDASGIGGYGEMVLYTVGMKEPVVIEFLTRVPELAGLNHASFLQNGRLPPDGPVLVNVPGTVAGMWKAWKKYGSGELEWSDLIEPAIVLARDGFELDDAFPTTLRREELSFRKYESSRKLFFPRDEPLQEGERFRNPDLSWTLGQIAAGGAEAFYKGEVARRIVADLRAKGSPVQLSDFSRYFAAERKPVSGTYRENTLYSSVPASSGGTSLVTKLNLLEQFSSPRLYSEDSATLHAMIEAWKLAPSTRGKIADPGLWPVDLKPLLDVEAARRRWERCFDPEGASGPAELKGDGKIACEDQQVALAWGEENPCADPSPDRRCHLSGTTAFAVADKAGNLVSVTQTLGTWGGNFYVSPGLGFIYNDKLRSYSQNPDSYGARIPFARNGTSIAPTLVFRGTGSSRRPWLAVGAAGNAWITSAVYQMVAAMIDAEIGPQQALELPRFLVSVRRGQTGGERGIREIITQFESGIDPAVLRHLVDKRHTFQAISLRGELRMGYGAVVAIEDGTVRAGADPRRSGAAAAVP